MAKKKDMQMMKEALANGCYDSVGKIADVTFVKETTRGKKIYLVTLVETREVHVMHDKVLGMTYAEIVK